MKIFKKFSLLIILFTLIVLFIGCSNPKYIKLSKKTSNSFYSQNLYKLIKTDDFKLTILDSNFYKELSVDNENKLVIRDFLSSLSKNNFITKPENLPSKPVYKIFIKFSHDKYVINIFNENLVSIFPWDATYEEDYISTDEVPIRYNLFNFANNFFNK